MTEESKPEEPMPKDIFEDETFDCNLFALPKQKIAQELPSPEDEAPEPEPESPITGFCPYYPIGCFKQGTSQCTKECERHPGSFIEDPKIKEVFDIEPWSNWCFDCNEFVPSRRHEMALDPPELEYSHTVATGLQEYKSKLKDWVFKRMGGGI